MRRAHRLPAGSGTVPMVTRSLQDKARDTHLLQMSENRKQVEPGRGWRGEEKEMAVRKEVYLWVEVPQPPRKVVNWDLRWYEQVGPHSLLQPGAGEKRHVMVPTRLMLGVFRLQNSLQGQVEALGTLPKPERRLFHNSPSAGTKCPCSSDEDAGAQSRGQCTVQRHAVTRPPMRIAHFSKSPRPKSHILMGRLCSPTLCPLLPNSRH